MTILEMIAEWRNGCSDAGPDHPEGCQQCTRALIDAIEVRLNSPFRGESGAGHGAQVIFEGGGGSALECRPWNIEIL